MASTLMLCEGPAGEVETAYLAALAAVRSYTATADALTMFDSAGSTILTFAATDPTAIEGVTWHATMINNGNQGVESVVAGTDPTMTYDPAGTVSGSAGCNQYNGPATLDGSTISIGPLASTKRACVDEAANTQEVAFLAALENATTLQRRGDTLELRDDSGALQVSFTAG
jgi:heat shock protein HslJ